MMKVILLIIMFYFFVNNYKGLKILLIFQYLFFLMYLMLMMNYNLNFMNMWIKVSNYLGMDFYSWVLILLSIWIIGVVVINLNNIKGMNMLMNLLIMLMLVLILCFSSLNMIMFYFYFEVSLLPIYIMIIGWGNQVERVQAGMYMMIYTLIGSMPLFLVIMHLYNLEYSLMMSMVKIYSINNYMYVGLVMAFLMKMPMYFLHLWLPKAHVEASVFGSMILAGVMLKLGSYGLIRVLFMMMGSSILLNKFLIMVSLIGGLISSLICLIQVDMKMLVAYSSVVHMSLLMVGILTLFNIGMMGGLMMMLAHGLCSSGLFYLVNIYYLRVQSRSFYINKGMISIFPSLSMMLFLLCSSNMSFPPSLNLFSEIFLLNSVIMWSSDMMIILMIMLFFSAFYCLFIYTFSQHGKFNLLNKILLSIKIIEYYTVFLHWIPLNLLFIMMILFV